MIACSKGDLKLTKYLILEKHVDVNIKDNNKHNALFYAINNDNSQELSDICELLLNERCGVNIETTDGFTLLWKAIEAQHTKVVQLLCDNDILVNLANKSTGETPLHLAVSLKNKRIIEILMEKLAKVDKKNKKNQTPYDLVKDDEELTDFLKKLEKKQNVLFFLKKN